MEHRGKLKFMRRMIHKTTPNAGGIDGLFRQIITKERYYHATDERQYSLAVASGHTRHHFGCHLSLMFTAYR